MSEDKLRKIADCLEEESFEDGQCIIKQVRHLPFQMVENKVFLQGTKGDIFFIIRDGEVRITTDQKDGTEKEVARLGKAAYFGEAALIKVRSLSNVNLNPYWQILENSFKNFFEVSVFLLMSQISILFMP